MNLKNERIGGGKLLEALANGKPTMAAYQSLWFAAQMWLADSRDIPMERYAGLPATGPSLRRATRNLWLRHAALLVPPNTSEPVAQALHREWESFLSRGPWLAWRPHRSPPPEASALRQALFFASKLNNGDSVCLRTVQRALA